MGRLARSAPLFFAALAIASCAGRATFQFTVRDAVSKAWVWDLTSHLEDRASISFFQSDAGPIPQLFTRLNPGNATLLLSAPGYQAQSIPVTLSRGANVLARPVDMLGLEIPNLDHWIVFEKVNGRDIVCQLRPVGTDGKAVVHHPCLDLWVGCRISVEVKDGLPVQKDEETGAARGRDLFKQQISWKWDATPETLYRYIAFVPRSSIQDDPSPYRVIDYLIVVPNPVEISHVELKALLDQAWNLSDMTAVTKALDAQTGKLRWFVTTSWNVKVTEQ